jgi:hypothetical protein
VSADTAFAVAAATEQREEDVALGRELVRLLEAAGRPVARVLHATFEGASHDSPCRVVKNAQLVALTSPDAALARPWGPRATLFLNVDHTHVRLARRRAKSDLHVAAQLLVRTIVVAEGALTAKIVDRLLASASAKEETQ